jgi:hypothetical protein
MDNYAKQNMFGTPCTAPIDASLFFWVWLYSIKPHESDRKKVRGVCDGSTRGGKTMVHGATYAPTPQQIYVRLQIALSALMGVYLWHVDVANAFAEADCHDQIYYMHCDCVFQYWWVEQHSDISLPPMRLFVSSRTSRVILEARASGQFVAIQSLSRSSSRTLRMLRVCTTALLMMSPSSFFEWSTMFPLRNNLRKRIPSYVTCWTRIGKCPCRDTA